MNLLALIFPKSQDGTSADREWKRFQSSLRVPKGWQVCGHGIPDLPQPSSLPEIGSAAIFLFCARSEADFPFIVRVLYLLELQGGEGRRRRNSPWILTYLKDPGVNPEPLASFVDGFLLDEPQKILPRICFAFSSGRKFWTSPAAIIP